MSFFSNLGKFVTEQYQQEKQRRADAASRREQAEKDREECEKREKLERIERERLESIKREPHIRKYYDDKLNVLEWNTGWINWTTSEFINGKNQEYRFDIHVTIARSLASMSNREIEILKYNDLFDNYKLIDRTTYKKIHFSIIYNDGNCKYEVDNQLFVSKGYAEKYSLNNYSDYVKHVVEGIGCANKDAAISEFLSNFSSIEKQHGDLPLVIEFREKIIGGSKWLSDSDLENTIFSTQKDNSLFIGATETGQPVWFSHEGSLVSIAPPGSGKTQCHVFPNLLSYQGPTVVLDIKGECYDMTNEWRKAHVGPVFKFSPLNPGESARYNPLAMLSDDPDILWEECRLMADLLIVPTNSSDPTWENRARDVVAGVLAWLVINNPPERRSMGKVIDVISKVGWDNFIEDSKFIIDVPAVSRLGNSLAVMPEKQLEGVLDAARRHLAIWEGNRVERVTSTCDWTPEVLRDGSNTTIYICIPPNEIESYAPLLRVLLAQHLRHLLRKLPEPGKNIVPYYLCLMKCPGWEQ